MKKFLAVLLIAAFIQSAPCSAAGSSPNPADYPLVVHVLFSRNAWIQVVIDGQPMELTAGSNPAAVIILAPGDYRGRLIPRKPKGLANYEVKADYDLLMEDGKICSYQVSGISEKSASTLMPRPPASTQ